MEFSHHQMVWWWISSSWDVLMMGFGHCWMSLYHSNWLSFYLLLLCSCTTYNRNSPPLICFAQEGMFHGHWICISACLAIITLTLLFFIPECFSCTCNISSVKIVVILSKLICNWYFRNWQSSSIVSFDCHSHICHSLVFQLFFIDLSRIKFGSTQRVIDRLFPVSIGLL